MLRPADTSRYGFTQAVSAAKFLGRPLADVMKQKTDNCAVNASTAKPAVTGLESPVGDAGPSTCLPAVRWAIAGLLFLAAVLNYVDKNSLALLAPTIQRDLGFGDRAYANVQNAFQIAYTVALLGSGWMVDRYGSRISLGLFVAWWSVANVLTGWARSFGSLAAVRFLLGLGEAGNWTASPRAVSHWFPARERGLAIGIYTAGTPIGMTLAPLFVVGLAGAFGWRAVFVVTGALGLTWVGAWWGLHRVAPASEQPVAAEADPAEAGTAEMGWTWRQALRQPEVWCLLLGRMFSDPIWFFYQNWYPKYLVSERGWTQEQVKGLWVLFLAAGAGSVLGGWISGHFIRRGASPRHVRLWTMLGCAVLMPLSPLVACVPTADLSLMLASVVVFAHLAWLVNISTLVVDVVPRPSLAMVFGIVAAGSSIGAIMMNEMVARLVSHGSYASWFVVAAFPHLLVLPPLMWGLLRRAPDPAP